MFIVLDKSNTATSTQRQHIPTTIIETSTMCPADQHAVSARTIAETASAL